MRSRSHQASHDEEEGYFASVGDLMVGVLFVFLLMLTVFALNFRDAEQKQVIERRLFEEKQKEAEHLRDLLRRAMTQIEREISDRAAARSELLASMNRALQERGVHVFLDQRSGILRLSGDLLFPTGSAVLGPAALHTVQLVAGVLAATVPCYAAGGAVRSCVSPQPIIETVLVEGHTDRQTYVGFETAQSQQQNDKLSAARALSVFIELLKARPDLDQLLNGDKLPLLGVSGYGQRRPLPDSACTSADCQENRRIDLRFVLSARSADELNRLRQEISQAVAPAR